MGNPNPFYRFKQGWNAGFYPDNQIASDLLNEVHGIVTTNLAGWVTPGVTTINQLLNSVKALVNTYNAAPYYGGMSVSLDLVSAPPDYNYTITVKYDDLFVVDASQYFTITGTASNPGKVIATAVLSAFTPGSYIGTFDATLVPEEDKVKEALEIVNINGSAIFPITYSYNSTTGIATSGLARAKNWQLVDGSINRLPAPTNPFQNQRTFQLPQLNGDDTYINSVMERIIQASLADGDYTTSVLATFNSFTMPDAYTSAVNYPAYTTYERVQFDFIDATRRCFSLIGRKDGGWLWQRFVTDQTSPYDFLSNYTEVDALPYEVMQAGRWVYPNDTYDFEFVEFTSGCYVSPEFYPMPAKPGDQLQFTIVDGNLEGTTNVNVGLFSTEGQFIQKIGNATKGSQNCACEPGSTCSLVVSYSISDSQWNQYLINLSQFNDGPVSVRFDLIKNGSIIDTGGQSYVSPPTTWTTSDVEEQVALLSGLTLVNSGGFYTFSINILNALCGDEYVLKNVITEADVAPPQPFIDVFTSDVYSCQGTESSVTQFQAQATIPSKQGCYRLGLYEGESSGTPVTTCELALTLNLEEGSIEFNEWFLAVSNVASGTGVLGIYVNGLDTVYTYDVSSGLDYPTFFTWLNTIPGMVATYGPGFSFQWTWTVEVPCDTGNYYIDQCEWDHACISNVYASPDVQSCECDTPVGTGNGYLYSLSNIINIDKADCFSTILEFWSDNNTMAEGFEYYNNWKQRVRIGLNGGGEKPVIEESLYRQSNGVHRRPQNKQDLSLDLHTDFFDLETQLAMTDATRHPYLIWEGKPIFVKGDIEVATTQDFTTQSSFETLSQMKFQALLQGFQPRNSSCLNC